MHGFAGSSMLPTQIRGPLSQVIECIGVNKTAGIRDTVLWVVGHDLLLLEVNAVVIIFRERGSSEVLARKIARHAPPLQPWGVDFSVCGTLNCTQKPHHFFIKNNSHAVCVMCRFCGWRSEWVDDNHLADRGVFKVDRSLPNIFWHPYPPLPSLQNVFMDITEIKRWGQAKRSQT